MSVSIKEMLEAGVHFGHQTKYWNPKMKPFIFGSRNKIHVINLDKTLPLFEEAIKFVKQTIKNKGDIMFVGAKAQASEIISEEAKRCGMPYVDHRWLGGMLTNFETVKKSIKKLETKTELLAQPDAGLSKKELLDVAREVEKLQKTIGGIVEMKGLPSAMFVVDTGMHDIAIKEAKKLGIPVIGIVDTNNDPSSIDYVIPGNDDSARAIRLYAAAVADAILAAKEETVTDLVKSANKVEMVEEAAAAESKTVRRVKKAVKEEQEENAPLVEEISADEAAVKEAVAEETATEEASVIKATETATKKPAAKKVAAKKEVANEPVTKEELVAEAAE